MRIVPKTLTARLVVTAVALVALVSVLVAVVTTFAMNRYLTNQLDQKVGQALGRVADSDRGRLPGLPGPADASGLFRGPQTVGTLAVYLTGSKGGGVLVDDGTRGSVRTLTSAQRSRLGHVPADGGAHTIQLQGYGDYRVVVATAGDGGKVAVGLPTREITSATESLLLSSLLLALGGVALAGLLGTVLVRRQLRPLRAVATTAYDVTAMPLESGGQTIETRVAPELTDPTTEVGRVGSALNTLLDHVDAALDSRHRSEQQVRQFVADASHELRTPLSTIHGYAELSRRTPDDSAALSAAMAKVETEATRMTSLVNDLLLLARLDSGRPLEREEVDVTMLLLEAVADARVVAPDHEWRLDLPHQPVTVVGDEQRLHQVVTNLINNAARHTPARTVVTVSTRPPQGSGEPAVIRVHDDGPGISEELAEHVFERFTRGDTSRTRSSGGAGLGLSLVQAITEAHGGTATVTSHPGDTTFTLSLP
jgi:two-component system OmpR family sensor kinase